MDVQKIWDLGQRLTLDYGPKLVFALAILAAAYIVGRILAYVARHVISRTGWNGADELGEAIGKALFWVTILVALPGVLGSLGMSGLLEPVQEMSTTFLNFLPNLVGAGLIFGIGFMVAKVAKEAVTSVLRAAHVDTLAQKFGLTTLSMPSEAPASTKKKKKQTVEDDHVIDTDISKMETADGGLAGFAGTLLFTLLIIPISIAALDTLGIESISAPAKQMLQSVLDAIPHVFAAAIVLGLAFFIARFASNTLAKLLPTTGIDAVGERLGLSQEVIGKTSASQIAGAITFAAIMIFGLIEAAKLLNFSIVSDLMTHLLELGGRVLMGSLIIGFGVIVADFVADIVAKSRDAKSIAPVIKIAIIVLAVAMGLRQMGLANEIINTGFTLLIGALAVGAAIAIGWGGKDTAGRLLEKWTKNL